ncbi:MAG TPA: hypothetical protein VHF92_00545 [Geodermatophilus sp.]|nr:hypothetical protein [Geodermatophilus sp.]
MTSSPQVGRAGKPAALAVPAWAWALTLYALAVLFVVLQDNGLAFVLSADIVHDFFHDARHSLGVPCH